ncbi:hypothetical protein QTO34_009163, partial [Cnephaeus nilssonii]
MFLDLLTPLLNLAKCVPVTLRIKPKFLTTGTSSCVKPLLPPLPHHDSALAFSPLQHPKLPPSGNLPCSPALMIVFSALRSQLKCHLLKDDFHPQPLRGPAADTRCASQRQGSQVSAAVPLSGRCAPCASQQQGSPLSSRRPSKVGELGACLLWHQAFQKPPPSQRLLKGLVHQRTGTQLHHQKRKR